MNTRCFLMLLCVAPLLLAAGCAAAPDTPADGASPSAGEKPKVEENSNPNVAPAPHAPGEGAQFAPVARPWTDRPSKKPWSELILGKWLHVNRQGLLGQKVWEFTRDGKVISTYSYRATRSHPKGIEMSTWAYHVSGNNLFPTSTHDDGTRVEESTTFIEILTEHQLIMFAINRKRLSLHYAKQAAAARKIPVGQVLAEVTETRGRGVYVRLKDKDK